MRYAVAFLLFVLVAALFVFGGIAAGASVGKTLLVLLIVLVVVSLLYRLIRKG